MQVVNRLFCDLHMFRDGDSTYQTPFANRVAVFANDGSQCLPVIPRGSRGDTLAATLYHAPFKNHMRTYTLTENMRARAQNDPEWAEFLLRVGKGIVPTFAHGLCQYDDIIRLPDDIISADGEESTLIEFVYGSGNANDIMDPAFLLGRTIMCPTVRECARLNDVILHDLIPGVSTRHPCVDELIDTTGNAAMAGGNWTLLYDRFPAEVLARLEPNGVPAAVLTFKNSMLLILTRNLRVSHGLCNGTRLLLLDYTLNILRCRVIGGPSDADVTFIPRTWSTVADGTSAVAFRRRQFPVSPGYVTTIHRQQGATLIRAGLWLNTSIFAHGLLYTALSRVGSSASIRVSVKVLYGVQGTFAGEPGTYTRNVYYTEMDDLIRDRLQAYPERVPGRTLEDHAVVDTMDAAEAAIAATRATHNDYIRLAIAARIQSRLDGCRERVVELEDVIAELEEALASHGVPSDFPLLGLKAMTCSMCGDGPVCSFPRSLQHQGEFHEELCGSCGESSGLCHVCFYTAASRCSSCSHPAKTGVIDCSVCLQSGVEPAAPCEYSAPAGTSHQFCTQCTPHLIVCALCRGPLIGGRANVTPPAFLAAQAAAAVNNRFLLEHTLVLQTLNRAIVTLLAAQA
jgi:hypothetical protein